MAPQPPVPPASHLTAEAFFLGQWGQEHLSLAQQRLQLDHARQDLPSSLLGLFPRAQGPAASSQSALVPPAPTTPWCSQPPNGPDPSPLHLHARLVLLRHTAEQFREGDRPSKSALQDHDFLENEQFFLETLKKGSYNLTFHSA
ncbi:Fas-binding factor 1 [Saguinus oedipus]|uniref:Fas-binding factor 1 n=1 Tax=Saguinus oedipus TaxID=9490 RepID=A0ABQ9VRS5_SAGOE|nr:Fas-binding factor 1 [Saguinus oedipus]